MEYSLDFSSGLIEAAESVQDGIEAPRAILYLSLLSCEISFKAVLENSGFSVSYLTGRGHRIHDLVEDVTSCTLINEGYLATGIRAKVARDGIANPTVGVLLTASVAECSQYPNQVRYGQIVTHFPPSTMLICAKIVRDWCRENFDNLRRDNPS